MKCRHLEEEIQFIVKFFGKKILAQCTEDFVIKCLKIKWTGLAGNDFAATRRVRTEQPLLDQIRNLRLLNFWGFGDWL